MTARPGFPDLDIAPASTVVAPVGFVTARGDDADPALDGVRRGIADVRLEVFVGEQAVPFVLEIDARDFLATTVHVLAVGADGAALGAGRLLRDPVRPGRVHLGRLAVRRIARGTGLGARLVAALEAAAPTALALAPGAGAPSPAIPGGAGITVVLAAQEQAMGFYERCGYREVGGGRYLDAGIWHRDMARTLPGVGAP
ncbi:GNAT family N-acetyltransferase [uncultured Actinomyces sp.]|uniref:GNAT family N-acetyltransferase n=1 Tax=uncultured Actinomyces sp. TaxID=249061 RepID=UPI00288C4C7D|nr:GNAT family N-acetyltransferase [uncultured Actinomyces sp.]